MQQSRSIDQIGVGQRCSITSKPKVTLHVRPAATTTRKVEAAVEEVRLITVTVQASQTNDFELNGEALLIVKEGLSTALTSRGDI
jgi:hypothetical protein